MRTDVTKLMSLFANFAKTLKNHDVTTDLSLLATYSILELHILHPALADVNSL